MRYLLGYRHPSCRLYKPKVNQKRRIGLLSLMVGDLILPMTFGAGFALTKLITKLNPLFLYQWNN